MNIQIEKILLHRRGGVDTAMFKFETGKINLISGKSAKGKTSFIDTTDYALCSKECKIDKHIRRVVDFVGVALLINGSRHLFARHVPYESDKGMLCYHSELNATDDDFTVENFTPKTGVSNVKMLAVLNRLIGADVAEELSATGATKHLSIRPLMDIVSQEYGVISDEDHLFRNVADPFVKRTLIDWVPYVVGIRTTDGMRARIERDDAEARHDKLLRELTNARALSERWIIELDIEFEQCRKLGILGADEKFPEGIEGYVLAFREIKKRAGSFYAASLSTAIQDESAKALGELEQEQQELSLELHAVQERLDALELCDDEVDETLAVAHRFETRLMLAEWLGEVWKGESTLPLFVATLGKTGEELTEELDRMGEALKSYQASLTNRDRIKEYRIAHVRERGALTAKRRELEEKYRRVAEKIDARAKADAKSRELLDAQRAAYMQIGRIEKMVTLAQALVGKDPDDNELETLRLQSEAAGERVKAEEDAEKSREIDFSSSIATLITERVRELDASPDMQSADASFDTGRLDIRLKYPTSEEWLSERGSSGNHIAFHVAITAAFQEYLVDKDFSPLPSFVFYDQPTQSKADQQTVALDLLIAALLKSVAKSKERNAAGWQPIVIDLIDEGRLANLDREKFNLVVNLDQEGGFVPPTWWKD